MDKPIEDLSKQELLRLARVLAEAAHEPARVAHANHIATAKDPLVRSIAAVGMRALRKEFSYREIAQMFGVSHSRIHQLEHDLEDRVPEVAEELERRSESA